MTFGKKVFTLNFKIMKKSIFSKVLVLCLGLFMAFSISLQAQEGGGGDEGCEGSTVIDGPLIVVTVCERKTSLADLLLGVSCGTEDTDSCSFNNINPNTQD